MAAPYRWVFHSLATAVILAVTGSASFAQSKPTKANPNPGGPGGVEQPKTALQKNPFAPIPVPATQPFSNSKRSSVWLMPSINNGPGIPMAPIYQQTIPSFWNPAIDNPWMDQFAVRRVPVMPFRNPFVMNPFLANPLFVNPLLFNRPFNYPFGVPGYRSSSTLSPSVAYAPPVAAKELGAITYSSSDPQVSPAPGAAYQPISGLVTLADGSTFYRVTGSGAPTANGEYSSVNGLYNNPLGGTFFNPSSGLLEMPAYANIFMPYVW